MKKTVKCLMAVMLTVLMLVTSMPVNTVFADDDVPVTTEVTEQEEKEKEEIGEEPKEEPQAAEDQPVLTEDPVYEVDTPEEGNTENTEDTVEEVPAEEVPEETPAEEEPVEEVLLNKDPYFEEFTVGSLTVTVSYEEGTLPEGTEVKVGEGKEEALKALKEKLGEEASFAAADISFVYNGEEIEPKDFSDKKVKVTLSYSGEEDLTGVQFTTYHVAESLNEEGTLVYGIETVEAAHEDITKTVTKYKDVDVYEDVEVAYEEEEPVYETREITEERTTYVEKTREVEKTRMVKVKVPFKWYDVTTWFGYKLVPETYTVIETYEEPVTETVVVGYEEVQVGTRTVTKYRTERQYVRTDTVEDGTEDIVVGQTVSFETDQFSTYALAIDEIEELDVDLANISMVNISSLQNTLRADSTHITASKDLTDNLDENGQPNGTKKLSLSVKGEAQSDTITNVTKSNVVIMIDLSGSMNDDISWQLIEYKYDSSTYIDGENYIGVVNGNYVLLRRNNNRWQYRNGTSYYSPWYDYDSSEVYWYVDTRLEATKAAAYALIDALLENNTATDQDIMEISLAKFANKEETDTYDYGTYNGTETLVHKSHTASELKSAIRNMVANGGTNWEAAFKECLKEANSIHTNGETTSVIFLTDGKPTLYGNDNGTGREGDSNVQECWGEAKDDAKAIVDAGYDLYNIFAYGSGSSYLKSMTNYAYRGTGNYNSTDTHTYSDGTTTLDHFYDASSTDALIEAFKAIIDKINKKVGFAGVDFEDGVTLGVTNTSVVVDGTVHEDSFHYEVTDKDGDTVYTVQFKNGTATFTIDGNTYTDSTPEPVVTKIDPEVETTWITSQVYSVTVGEGENAITYKMSPATINTSTGLIDWDLAGLGILEDGWTYTLSFDLWPNQLAYDMIADLNNGVTTLEEVEATIKEGQGEAAWNQIADALVVTFNGVSKPISELIAEERAAINNGTYECTYAVYTNWKQEVSYYTADQEVDEQGNVVNIVYSEKKTHNPTQPEAVALTSSTMSLRKLWSADLDISQYQKLLYNPDGSSKKYKIDLKVWKADTKAALDALVDADGNDYYKKVTLGWDEAANDYDWDTTLDVAPGNMIDETLFNKMGLDPDNYNTVTFNGTKYYVLESGHYYTVTEVTHDYHFDLVAIVYHPMLVNGKLSNVTFKDDGTVETINPMTTVDATNTLRGGINLKKVVLATDGTEYPTDDEFSFTIVFQNDKGLFVGDDIPWYGFNGMYYHDEEGNYIPSSATGDQDHDGLEDDGNIPVVTNDGKTATYTLKLTAADSVRINNVPIGTTYTITETQLPAFVLDSVVKQIGLDAPVLDEDGRIQYDEDGNVITQWKTESEETTHELTVSGEIVADSENNITYKNKMKSDPVFYVYHSSNNKIEKVSAFDDRVTREVDENTKLMKLTFNLAKETLTGNLYGGYYKSYPGAVLTDDEIKGLTYTEDTAGVVTAYDGTHTGGLWASDDEAAKPYDYAYIASVKAGTENDWVSADGNVYTVNGLAMNPAVDTVYYLKEVPNHYDLPYTHYTYNTGDKVIRNMWYITAIDDLNYDTVGFVISDGKKATVVQTMTVQNASGGATVTLSPKSVFGGGEGNPYVQDGYIGYWDSSALIAANSNVTFTPYWKTMDGVSVRGLTTRTINFNNGKVGSGGMRIVNDDTVTAKLLEDITLGN